MGDGDESARETEASREGDEATPEAESPPEPDPGKCASALGAAILRIGASLDLDTVLEEVVESARVLTGATYGVIATVDESREPRDFVTSGLTEEERRAMEAWSDGLSLFGHLRSLATPLRLPDFDAWTRSLGCAPFPVPCGAFQATPMRHRGTVAGGFFRSGKAGGFTDADEEMHDDAMADRRPGLGSGRRHRRRVRRSQPPIRRLSPEWRAGHGSRCSRPSCSW